MHHIGTITITTKHPTHGFHAQCSCGPAGDFATKEEAESYLRGHFAKQGGLSTSELLDRTDEPESFPVLPTPHVAGVGLMPASHATQSPAEWPASEQPQTVEQLEHDGPAGEVTHTIPGEEVAPVATDPAPEPEQSWKKKKK
jgi:hypothetical protein